MHHLDWKYQGEGGKHALFCYQGSENGEIRSKLLRISKDCFSATLSSGRQVNVNPALYVKSFVALCISPYVEDSEVVVLDSDFITSLHARILAEGLVPAHRKKDWQRCDQGRDFGSTVHNKRPVFYGTLVRDYRFFADLEPFLSTPSSLVIEIKPKAGYRAFSPLVATQARFKYKYTRHSVIGAFKNAELGKPLYDPVDLFSGERASICKALHALFRDPRSNLTVWQSRNVVCKGDLVAAVRQCSGGRIKNLDALVNAVSGILQNENLLSNLLALQRLDILDADGAIVVYQRLVHICDGSEATANKRIDEMPKRRRGESIHQLMKSSPIAPPDEFVTIFELLNSVVEFQGILAASLPDLPCEAVLDAKRGAALEIVNRLNGDDCVYLLQNWLLSLAMCDVSLFLRLRFRIDSVPAPNEAQCLKQTLKDAGRYNSGGNYVDYFINVIDVDQKPAEKLSKRHAKEVELISGAAQL